MTRGKAKKNSHKAPVSLIVRESPVKSKISGKKDKNTVNPGNSEIILSKRNREGPWAGLDYPDSWDNLNEKFRIQSIQKQSFHFGFRIHNVPDS